MTKKYNSDKIRFLMDGIDSKRFIMLLKYYDIEIKTSIASKIRKEINVLSYNGYTRNPNYKTKTPTSPLPYIRLLKYKIWKEYKPD